MATQTLPIAAGQTIFPTGIAIDGVQSSGIGKLTITSLLTGTVRTYNLIAGLNAFGIAISAYEQPSTIQVTSTVACSINIQGARGPGVSPVPTLMTVANLPAAGAGLAGCSAVVSDSTLAYIAANVGAAVVGGGANVTQVFCNGTAWVIG